MPVIPKNEAAENAVIGCLLMGASPNGVPLREDHFSLEDCRQVFAAIRDLADQHQPITLQTVTSRLTAEGKLAAAGGPPSRFLSIEMPIGGDSMLAHYFPELESARRNRAAVLHVHAHLGELTNLSLDAGEFAEQLIEVAAPVAVAERGDEVAEIIRRKEERMLSGEPREVFPTGLAPLDRHISGGFYRSNLGVVAGATGQGKSALLIQAAAHCAELGFKVRYFSLELGDEEVIDRMACALRGVAPHGPAFRAALCDLAALPIKVHSQFSELREITAEIRAAVRAGDCDLAVVDYIQRVSNPAETRELQIGGIAEALKTIAMREEIVVLTASQLNDAGQLRESRRIGMEADFVFRITENGLMVDKARRAAPEVVLPCHLIGIQSRFVPTARGRE